MARAPKTRFGWRRAPAVLSMTSPAVTLGRCETLISTASNRNIPVKIIYGILTASAPSIFGPAKYLKIKKPPISGPIVVPKELKPCDKFSLLEADFSEPNMATYGLAAIWRRVNPSPITNRAARKKPYILNSAAG